MLVLVVLAVTLVYGLRRRNASREALLIAVVAIVVALLSVASIEGVAYDYLSTWVSAVAVFTVVALAAALLMSAPTTPRSVPPSRSCAWPRSSWPACSTCTSRSRFATRATPMRTPRGSGCKRVDRDAGAPRTGPSWSRARPDLASAGASSGLLLRLVRAGIKIGVPEGVGLRLRPPADRHRPRGGVLLGVSVVALTTRGAARSAGHAPARAHQRRIAGPAAALRALFSPRCSASRNRSATTRSGGSRRCSRAG